MKVAFRNVARVVAAAGLAVDAYVHLDLASRYDLVKGSLSEGDLFRIEAGVAVAAVLALLLFDRWWAAAAALAVSGSDVAAILLYRFINVGTLGPLPNMYEPIWFAHKVVALVGVLIAFGAALVCLLLASARARGSRNGDYDLRPASGSKLTSTDSSGRRSSSRAISARTRWSASVSGG